MGVIVISIVTYAVVFLLDTGKSYDPEAEKIFHVDDVDQIQKIFIAGRHHDPVTLERKDDHWLVNGKYEALDYKIDLLLSTIRRVRMKYPVPERQLNRALNDLRASGIKVELYNDNMDKPFHVYYVGMHTSDYLGTYMIREFDGEVAEWPYVTHIPGFHGFLTPRYVTQSEDWRDLTVFDYPLDEIASVKVEYPSNPSASFEIISKGNDNFKVLNHNRPEETERPVYKTAVLEYLNNFNGVNAEAFENRLPSKDSIMMTTPAAKIAVETASGKKNAIRIFYMPVSQRTKMPYVNGVLRDYDPDRYFAAINEEQDLVIIQDFIFGKFFRSYDEFFMSPM
ncbi:MAG: hypothetical protein EA412_13130 [Chitinophagaceae bacterium]|nr:MAG: hypothetical protein EA412_13130 [Chitinophagaceae bacterium]